MSYTPRLGSLRVAYRLMEADLMMDPDSKPHDPELMAESDAEFDRAIAQVRADAKREAWDEGVKAAVDSECYNPPCGSCEACDTILVNPYEVS